MLTLTIRTDHVNSRYLCGEKIVFTPELASGASAAAKIEYKIFHDNDLPIATGVWDAESAPCGITHKADTPGFVQCEATYQPQDQTPPLTAAIGAAVEPEKLRPAAPRPADFDEFWQTHLTKLAAVPMETRMMPIACDYATLYDLRITCLGAPVRGYFAMPAGDAKTLPALIQFQGAGVKSAFLDAPLLWASRGYLALCINAHGIPNGLPAEFYDDLAAGALADYRYRGLEDRNTYYMLGMFLRVKRAIEFIAGRPEWDGKNLFLMGHSQGAFQAIAGAYLDKRVSALAAGVPAGCDLCGTLAGRCEGWPKISTVFTLPRRDHEKIIATAPYFDNANFLAGITCPAIFSVGWIDKSCRPTSIYAALHNCAGPKTVLDYPTMPHASPENVRAAFADFLERQRRPC